MKKHVLCLILCCLAGIINSTSTKAQRVYKTFPAELAPRKYNLVAIDVLRQKVMSTAFNIVSVLPKNYVKDGSLDYTNIVQKAITTYDNILFPDFPLLINKKGLTVGSNKNLIFSTNSKLIMEANSEEYYEVLRLHNVNNVKIFDAKIEGDKPRHLGKNGEWGMGIAIRSSSNVSLYNPNISKCWGDGIYIGGLLEKARGRVHLLKPSENIDIYNGFIDDNRRNGISVVSVINLNIYNSVIANSLGTWPKSGIDIEPTNTIESILIQNTVTYNNGGRGIDIFLSSISKYKDKTIGIKINNHSDYISAIGLRIAGFKKTSGLHPLKGNVHVSNSKWQGNGYSPLVIEPNQKYAPVITFTKNSAYLTNSRKLIDNSELKLLPRVAKGSLGDKFNFKN